MPAIQQWWYSRSANPDSPIYVPPEEHPGTYRLVWGHSFDTPPAENGIENPAFGENTPLVGTFGIMEYDGYGTGTGTALPLTSVVLTVTTTKLTNNNPSQSADYAASTNFSKITGVWYDIPNNHTFTGQIRGKQNASSSPTVPFSYVLGWETCDIIITAVVNGVPATGTLRMRSTAPDGNLHLTYFRTE